MPTVHPHVCGEHTKETLVYVCGHGSSPRVWGTFSDISRMDKRATVHPHVCGEHLRVNQPHIGGVRFIPTCVGNMFKFHWFLLFSSVHPHVCGEHRRERTVRGRAHGSSPRVWGTFKNTRKSVIFNRFIPTCVGNIHSSFVGILFPAVHPHVCGEHYNLPAPALR